MTSQQPPEGLSADKAALLAFKHSVIITHGYSTAEIEKRGGVDRLYAEYWPLNDSTLLRALNAARSTSPAPDPKAGGDETAWLIEETWSGYVHYVHKDFNCEKWASETRKNEEARRNGVPPRYPAVLITKDVEQAMRFATKDAADTWLAFQPNWVARGGQYQAREHMWAAPAPAKAGEREQVAEAVELLLLLERMANECSAPMDLWDAFSNAVMNTSAALAEARSEVERLTCSALLATSKDTSQ